MPLLRAGFPQYDLIGGYQKLWVGYRGTRQVLFDLANLQVEHGHHEVLMYRSIYASRNDTPLSQRGAGGIFPASALNQVAEIPDEAPTLRCPGPPFSKGEVSPQGGHDATPETRPLH